MISHPKHDYLLFTAVLILLLAAFGAVALHYGGATASGLKIDYACDIDRDRLNRFAENADLPEENCFTDYKELLLKYRPELVIIATWTDSHADIGITASANGAKTIICEKPIASNLVLAKNLIKECTNRNVNLIINHERRYEQRYRTVKNLLDENTIGEVKTVHSMILTSGYKGKSRIEEGGGPLLHDGTHLIDIIRYLFGDIDSVIGEIQRINRTHGYEDRATAWLKTESGIDVFLEAGGNRDFFLFELEIIGTKGKIVIGNGYEKLFLNRCSKFYTGFRDLDERTFPDANGVNCFEREYLEAKNTLNGNKTKIISSGNDGYKAMEVVHAIYLSSHLNGKRITLPIKPSKVDLQKIFNLNINSVN